ncbi:uncharacterized protein LOC122367779 [Amphibalanus amphitrite]|uniref:uncharacterized protein LOC122367779 n=1 Tax=Amphibalanus amphitrite TaxID=1232801 RepID=UPI001C911B39|nr:uncharacterized protein LOC122367779 [Amphibalanus amphitrite]
MRRAAILVAFLATGALSVPTGERKDVTTCARVCEDPTGAGGMFQPGSTHVFDYTSDVVTTLAGATDEESRLHVTATAEVTASTACDLTLQLRDVSLQDSDPKNANNRQDVDNMALFKQELERRPLHFSYQNGAIRHLCSDPAEPVWVVNFKRGVLSTLVTVDSMTGTEETVRQEEDVSGRCSARYSVSEHGESLLITKRKDLLTCSGRGHLVSSLQSTPYSSGADVQSLPLLKSTLQCDQKVHQGRLVSSVCHESHMFKPFSHGENGAVTRTTVTLSERTIRSAGKWWWQSSDAEMPTTRTSLMFDHTDAELTQHDRVPAAVELLNQLQEKTADNVRPDVPRLFTRLVHMLRHFTEDGLRQVDAQLESGSAAKRYFVDALPLAGSAPALALMKDMILAGLVNEETTDRWMTSLAFVHEPSVEMVAAVAPLLEARDVRRQTLLGVSSLVHHYCKTNVDCIDEAAVRSVVAQLERTLGSGCRAVSEDEEMKMLTALKALGNAGRLVDGSAKLRACFQDEENSMDVRLAAIRAFRRMPCSVVTESGLMKTFANPGEDTEVRVAAYLAVMQCPSYDIVDKVQEVLSAETVNQVSSFVWSHLTNMQETSDPNKSYMKSLLYNIKLADKFNTDMRKFSRYFEKTMFSESMNAGATVDANVVFAADSYIPRSGMFNLTVDLFGEAFNLLEVGGRVEGLQDLSESLFGDNGIYPQETISQLMKTMQGRQDNTRSARRIQTSQASAYMKIFGNELHFGKYDSLNELVASMGAKNPLDFLQKLAKDMDWTENYQFLDSSYTVPTIAGFPFTLKATGTATLSLKTGGSFDVQSWRQVNINGHIKPSAAVEIMSEMTVNAHIAHTGLKMNTNLHTSTILDGHAVVNGGELVSVRINMPRDKVEVLDVSTRFHSVFRNKARKLEMYTDNRYELKSCSDKYISTELLGVNFCADVSYSRGTNSLPSCLFSGPLTARFTVEKTDTIKAFEFEYQHSNEQGLRKSTFVIDTVGSAVDRRISVDYLINFDSSEFKAGFHTPIKSMDVSGALDLAGRTKRVDLSLKMDDRELFGVTSSLAVDDTAVSVRYTPSLSIRSSGDELANFQGNLIANKNKHKYSVDLTITKVFQSPLVFKGGLNEADGTYTVTTSMESFLLDGNMKGTFRVAGDNLLIQTNTEYSFANGQPQTIAVNAKLSQSEQDDEKAYRLFVDTKFSGMPMLDCQLRAERRVRSDSCQSSVTLIRGERTYELSSGLEFSRGKVGANVGFAAQHWDIDFKLGGNADFSEDNKVMVTGEAQLNQDYFAKTKVGLNYKSEESGFHYGVNAELALPRSTYIVNTGVRQEENSGHLRVVARHETNEEVSEVALVGALSLDAEELGGELTLSMPHFPRYELSARLVPGTGGLYLARAVAQAGPRVYTLGAELKTAQRPYELDLLFERPGDRRMSARVTALVTGDRPEVTVDLRFGRRITAVLAGNLYPSENTANLEIFWNKDVDDTERASVEVLLRETDVSASLKYPGRQIKLIGALHVDTWTAELSYAPGKVIRAEGNVPQDDSFVRVNVNTPLEGFTTLSLTYTKKPNQDYSSNPLDFEIVGRLEEQEARLVGHLLLHSAIETRLELFTPVPGWEKSQLSFRYLLDYNRFDGRVLLAKNDDEVALGGSFEMRQDLLLSKIHAALDLALPIDAFRKGKVGFDLKFGDAHLDGGVLVQWKDTREHELSVSLTSQHSFDHEAHMDSVLTIHTPFEGFEVMSSHLKFSSRAGHFHALMNMIHADVKMINFEVLSTKGFPTDNVKFVFNCAFCPLEILYEGNFGLETSHTGSVSTHWYGKELSFSFKQDQTMPREGSARSDVAASLVLPIDPSRYAMKITREVDISAHEVSEQSEFSWGSKKIANEMTVKWDAKMNDEDSLESLSFTGTGKLTTPFQGWESVEISHTSKVTKLNTRPSYSGYTKYVNNEGKTVEITDRMEFEDSLNWLLQRDITSESRWVSSATHSIRMSGEPSSVQLTVNSQMADETAQLQYSHQLRDIQFSASVSGNWFGCPTRGLKVAVRNAAEAVYPSLDITYDEGKTIRMYGSISKSLEKGQSSVTLEAPFTDRAVLSIEHDCDYNTKKFTVDYLHGDKRYVFDVDASTKRYLTSDAKLAIKFSSPPTCMGEGSIVFKYDMEDELKLKGMVTFNDWKMSTKSKLGMMKGHFTVNTPYTGYTLLSASYLFKGDEGEIRLKKEDAQILAVLSRAFSGSESTYIMRVNTPCAGYESMTLSINKPMNENRFNAEYQRGRLASISITTEYEISAPVFSISAEAQSTIEGFSTSGLYISYNMFDQEARFVLSKENKKIDTKVVVGLSALYSELSVEYSNTLLDFGLPQQLTVTGMYNVRDVKKSMELAVIKGEERFVFNAEAQLEDELNLFTVTINTPIDGYESAKLEARLHLTDSKILAKLELSKNEDILKAVFHAKRDEDTVGASVALHTPWEAYRLTTLSAEYGMGSLGGYVKLVAERNSDSYEIKGTMEEKDETVLLVLTTPFTGFERISTEGSFSKKDSGVHALLVLSRNQDEIRLALKTEVSWTKSKVSLDITTPFPGARFLGATAMYDIQSEQKTANVLVAVNEMHYGVNLFAYMKRGAATGLVELNTPVEDWENVKYQVTYDINNDEKVIEISYEKNGVKQVIAGRGSYDGENAYIDVITPLNGYENMGINGRYVNRRGKREAGYDAHVNDHRHRLYVLYERKGLESATLKVETPIEGMHSISVDARSQEFPDGMGYYINTNRDGKRNTIEIRTVKDDDSIGADISIQSYIEGLENVRLSGNIVTRGRRRSFSFKSVRGESQAEISGQIVMKRRSGKGKFKVNLPMIEEWGDIDASFEYDLGRTKTFQLTSTRGGVTREYSGSLQYSDTSFAVTLNTPFDGFETLSAEASRTEGPDGTITADIKLTRGDRKVKIDYNYNLSGSDGSGYVKITTPYDDFRTIKTSLSYNIGASSRTFEFMAQRDARKWHLKTSRSWADGEDHASLELHTPIEEISEVKIERNFNLQNLKAMTYNAAYERNGRKFSLSGTGSIKRKGKEASFDVSVSTPLEIGSLGATIAYDFASKPRTINGKVTAGNRYASLTASLAADGGSVSLVTTNEMLPKADFVYTADVSASKRSVQASLTLYDGRKLELDYLADYSRKNKANGHIYVQSTTFGDRKLIWDYATPKDDFAANLKYTSPNGNLDWSVTVDGKRYVQRKIVVKSSIESEIYTSSWMATIHYNTKNGFTTKNKLVYNGKTYSLNFDAKEVNGKREVSLSYSGQLLKGLQIEGTWTLPSNPAPKKEFDISYKRGPKEGSLKGSFQVSPGGKSGSVDIKITTPFKVVKSLDVDGSWDFILPNRILNINYNRNGGKTYSLDFVGSRQEEEGKPYGQYRLSVTTPPLEMRPNVFVSEHSIEVTFDMRYGTMFKWVVTSPIEEELLIDVKQSGNVRTVKAHYRYNDEIGLTPYMPPYVNIDFNSKRTNRRAGPKIDMTLNTNFEGFEDIEVNIDVSRGRPKSTVKVNYRRGTRTADMTAEFEMNQAGGGIRFDIKTPIEGFEQVSISGSYAKEPNYALNLDYSRGEKYVKVTSSLQYNAERSYGQLQSGSVDARFKLDSFITMPIDLLVTLDGSMEAQPRRSGQFKLVATLNGDTYSVDHRVSRAEAGRRTARMVILTPFKGPFKKIVYNADVSTAANKATISLEYGRKRIDLDVSWFAGEGRQYGAEIRLNTPYKPVQAVELDAKATLQPRGDVVDVLVHYRRGQKMVHVTGTVQPFAVDLHFETPTFGNFGVKGGYTPLDRALKVEAIVSLASGRDIGGSVTVKPGFRAKDMQLTIDIRTPVEGFERLGFDIAYTNIDNSNIMRVAFESPMTKRVELSFELTNLTDDYSTDFRAGVTTNYLGNAFTFKTTILRDRHGMKYELEIESPFHILPSFKITGRR